MLPNRRQFRATDLQGATIVRFSAGTAQVSRLPTGRDLARRVADRVPAGIARQLGSQRWPARVLRPLANAVLPKGLRVVRVRSGPAAGIRFLIDVASEKFYWSGTHEAHVLAVLGECLKPGMTFWDVGAHIGYVSLTATRFVGESGKVVAFEPTPSNVSRLTRNAELNGVHNIEVIPHAVADSVDEAAIYNRGTSLTWSLMVTDQDAPSESVHITTLDAMAAERPAPDAIKVDAEGAEVEVLRGGLSLLAGNGPTLLVEFTSEAELRESRQLLPHYRFTLIAANHWLGLPAYAFRNTPEQALG